MVDLVHERKFVEAVLEYTGAAEVDIISHSMGVTISRQIIKGGFVPQLDTPTYLGPPIADRVNTYIAIAGRNYGSSTCLDPYTYANERICNKITGAYPGS
jgi:triacylglycerol esterase/lipase EstA (alpha/beta hydrolase family)